MVKCALTATIQGNRFAKCLVLFSAQVVLLFIASPGIAQTQDIDVVTRARSQLRNVLKQNEAKWRETFRQELSKPVLAPLSDSQKYMPDALAGVVIGMGDSEVQAVRSCVKDDEIGGGDFLRETFEFVPAILTEPIKDPLWSEAAYRIHRRRLVGITLVSQLFKDGGRSSQLCEKLFIKYLAIAGRPNEIELAKDIWGQVNRAVMIWRKDAVFIALMHGQSDAGEEEVRLLIGSEVYYDDLIKYYSLAKMPRGVTEEKVRQRFPFLDRTVEFEKTVGGAE